MDHTIVIDIGNTSTAVGRASGSTVSGICHLQGGVKDPKAIDHVLKGIAADRPIVGAALCSVVPESVSVWVARVRELFNAETLVVSHRVALGVRIDYPKPASIGPDRLANSCGAVVRYGAPTIVADFGTALTFDVVDRSGTYTGGVIAPGLPLMTDYLSERTALLPHIKLRGRHGAVGRSTEGAMRIGAKIGYRGMVREIIAYLEEGMGERDVALCATGGYAKWALEGLGMGFHFDPDLTLFGAKCIWDLNQAG